jgi:outer membrane protein
MNTLVSATLAVMMLAASGLVSAAGVSVAVVNPIRLQSEAPQVASVGAKIKREFAERRQQIQQQQDEVRQLEEKLTRDQDTMPVEEAKSLQRDIRSRTLRMENAKEELESDRRLRLNEEMDRLRRVLAEVIAEVATAEGLDIVLESGFTWASERADITEKVLVRMRELDADAR